MCGIRREGTRHIPESFMTEIMSVRWNLVNYAILWSTTAGLLPQPVLISNCMSLFPTKLQSASSYLLFACHVYNIGHMILFTSIPSINPLSSPLPDCVHSSHVTRYWDGEVVSESHDQRGPAISADSEVSRVSHFPWLHGIRSGDVTFSSLYLQTWAVILSCEI